MSITLLSDYLETYYGRDKFLKILSYTAKLMTVFASSKETEDKLKSFSSQMSQCRVVLRLLDDIPMLNYAITYEWGRKEPDWLIRCVDLTQIAVDTIYYPIEHICWASENNIVKINSTLWNNVTTWFWIASLNLSLMRSIRKVRQLEAKKLQKLEPKDKTSAAETDLLINQQRSELLTSLRLLLDLSYAVSYLPSGILWGGRLKTWHVGALGTVSSCIGLYQALSAFAKQKIK